MQCLHLLNQLAACCACRAEETRPLPASSRLRDTLRVRAKNLGWAPDRVGTVSATSPFQEAAAAPPAPTTPEQESTGGLQVQGSGGGPQTQVSLDLLQVEAATGGMACLQWMLWASNWAAPANLTPSQSGPHL